MLPTQSSIATSSNERLPPRMSRSESAATYDTAACGPPPPLPPVAFEPPVLGAPAAGAPVAVGPAGAGPPRGVGAARSGRAGLGCGAARVFAAVLSAG